MVDPLIIERKKLFEHVASHLEAQLRAAVPGVTAVRLGTGGGLESPVTDVVTAAQRILDAEIIPPVRRAFSRTKCSTSR